jgi:hypothetical protein
MSDTTKKILVILLNVIASAILAFAEVFGWGLEWYVPVTMMLVIILDTWVGIQWVPPKKPSNETGGSS